MISRSLFLFAVALLSTAPVAAAELKTNPTAVVELFTSQGCSSCPPADALLSEIGTRKDVIALAYHVDYWDYIGWRDTFGSAAFSQLQRDYAAARGKARIYTPQLIVNGSKDVVGSRRDDVGAALGGAELPVPISLDAHDGMLTISAKGDDRFAGSKIWLVTFKSDAEVAIGRGENKDKVIDYSHIVRERHVVGMWDPNTGASLMLPVDDVLGADSDGAAVIIQQDANGDPGRILGGASFLR